jgi:hypothetical protein
MWYPCHLVFVANPPKGRAYSFHLLGLDQSMTTPTRDLEQFPNDDNGDILWTLRSNGDSLESPRDIEFSGVFAAEEKALEFAIRFLRSEMKVEMLEDEVEDEDRSEWRVNVFAFAPPSYTDICEFEQTINDFLEELDGEYEGWSTYLVPPENG